MPQNNHDAGYLWDMLSDIIGQRNVIAHQYDRIKQERIWSVVTDNIPMLTAQLYHFDLMMIQLFTSLLSRRGFKPPANS